MTTTCLTFRNLTKRFGSYTAVDDVSLDVEDGEFLTLLGPSGSGKTTCLMMAAGLVTPTDGDIFLWGERINDLASHKRGIGVVFQHYALFPHMTVFDNLAYPLKMRRTPKPEIRTRVQQTLDLVQLSEMGGRFPRQLSGGEQQRVALARALVFNPKVLLMDEPLGALDRKLRLRLQHEVRAIQQELGVTLLYVTHDQEEAMTMSDRIAVMRSGRIEQIDTPQRIYEQPVNHFVASFLGETNFFTGPIITSSEVCTAIDVGGGSQICATGATPAGGQATASVRPEKMRFLRPGEQAENCVHGKVNDCVFIGELWEYHVQLASEKSIIIRLANAPDAYLPERKEEVRVGWSILHTLVVEISTLQESTHISQR
jgi:putative spermidine/putrescine transport system ATP-binding protein